MNIQDYISSGIVESYVLGLADPAERSEFERMCMEHPEVEQARQDFERSLEHHAFAGALRPAAQVKSRLFAHLDVEADSTGDGRNDAPPFVIGSNDVTAKQSTASWLRYLAAASVILLLGSTALNLYFFTQYRSYTKRYNDLLAQQSDLAANNSVLQTKLRQYEESMSILNDPSLLVVRVSGQNAPASPDTSSLATVYWNPSTRDVYLTISKLPPADANRQYQLWAIVDGKPVDAGVLETDQPLPLLKMKSIQRADVFAITLERKGGVPAPEGPIYLLGKV